MEIPLILILAVGCVLIGVLLDNLYRMITNRKEADLESRLTGTLPDSRAERAQPVPPLRHPNLVEAAHLLRDLRDEHLVLEYGGKIYRSVKELDADQRQRFIKVQQDFSAWMEISQPKPSAEIIPETPQLPEQPAFRVTPVALETEVPASEQIRKSSMNPLEAMVSAIQSDIKVPEKPKSLASQVDEILQVKLRKSPLISRGIRLTESPDNTLEFRVGMEKYTSLDEVPYEDVRKIIREAVDEWGKKTAGD